MKSKANVAPSAIPAPTGGSHDSNPLELLDQVGVVGGLSAWLQRLRGAGICGVKASAQVREGGQDTIR
jgi:hypothetical protein